MAANLIATSYPRLVLGLGETGRSVLRFWRRQGVHCIAADSRAALADDAALGAELDGIESVLGELPAELADGVEEIIASPGVPMDHPVLLRARARGVRIRGDVDLFIEQADAPVIGITGSNGKSTVTALLGHLLATAGRRVAVGGNIGKPVLDLLENNVEYYVVELSSFQLERAEPLNLAAATVLNVTPDHLDRHGDMATYQQAKQRIFRGANAAVCHLEDPLTNPLLAVGAKMIGWRLGEPDLAEFGLREVNGESWFCRGFEAIAPRSALPLAGRHNAANGLAALALGAAVGLPPETLSAGFASFAGLPHRCQLVADKGRLRFVNDSKATNIGATVAAIRGLADEGDLILIAGGQSKGQDFSALKNSVIRHCQGLVVMGEAAGALTEMAGDALPVVTADSMPDAVSAAVKLASDGATILLSPACASFDQYSGFAARGEAFVSAVNALPGDTL